MTNPGRPTRYTADHAQLARHIYETGTTDEDVAHILCVHPDTLRRWRERYPEFDEACRAGKQVADKRVLFSLYRRAIGYDYTETKAFMPLGAKEPVMAQVTRHRPADVRAAIFWMRKRQRDEWGDVPEKPENFDLAERLGEALANVAAGRAGDDPG